MYTDTRNATPTMNEQQKRRIVRMTSNPVLMEALANREIQIPSTANLEQLLSDFSLLYLAMSDAKWPMR